MTNGEMMKAIFPSAEIDIGNGGNDIWIAIDCWTIFKKEWWDAEYKEPTTKNDLGVDCVARQDVERFIEGFINEYTPEEELEFINLELDGLNHLPPVTPQEPRWIPLTKRPMTDEEQEYYKKWSDVEGAMILDCPLPEDGQEVLVSYGGYVCVDTFCKDDGCYFEEVDIDDVTAWMPLPAPYEPQENANKNGGCENGGNNN